MVENDLFKRDVVADQVFIRKVLGVDMASGRPTVVFSDDRYHFVIEELDIGDPVPVVLCVDDGEVDGPRFEVFGRVVCFGVIDADFDQRKTFLEMREDCREPVKTGVSAGRDSQDPALARDHAGDLVADVVDLTEDHVGRAEHSLILSQKRGW